MYGIEKMITEYAETISKWKYPDEYAIYSFNSDAETIHELLTENYYACLDDNNNLIGYFCFGKSAGIPTVEEGVYDDTMLDIGLGLSPQLCGQKIGENFLRAGMKFAKENLGTVAFRLTVADFNIRAIKVYSKVGFVIKREVIHKKSHKKFLIMTQNNAN